jgi:predicted ATPase
MNKIVITGGPCAGKTSVMEALKTKLNQDAVFVPECATLILSGGFPAPPDQKFLGHEQFDNWMRHFQCAVYHTQLALEDLATSEARLENKEMIVCDRGTIDAVAYHPEGMAGFTDQFGTTMTAMHIRYNLVIFLESLAVGQPELFGRVGNEHRYETLEHAQHVNQLTFDAWKLRSNFHFISSRLSLEEKTEQVHQLITQTKRVGV